MAAELVGGAFLSAFLQVLFDRMASADVSDFIRREKLDPKLFQKLKATLLSVNEVLDDAEGKQIPNHNVKKWLNELKDAVYDAEDVLDEVATEAWRCKLEAAESQSTTTKVKNFFSSVNPFNKIIESKLQGILERFEYLERQKDTLSLKKGCGENFLRKLPGTSLLDKDDNIYGRDDEKEAVVKLLLSDSDDSRDSGLGLGVVSIVGMGGIGKTTLAQIVYNDYRVKEFFDVKIWVSVSENFDVFRVTKVILEAITGSSCEVGELNVLQVKLSECLMNKKFLLILDDVWNENYVLWVALRKPLTPGARGSRIIVTTRNESVASIMRTFPTFHLKELTDEQCWLLFANHAFGNTSSSLLLPDLETIGKKIVTKCHGLPLAAKAVVGLLRNKDVTEWQKVLDSSMWELSSDDGNILPALMLSYHYLPSHLKRCFAYCAIFPKSYDFEIEILVLLWMAEGFLPKPRRNQRLEEVGVDCFNNLLSRSFFQQSSRNQKHFVMHDLIHDLAKFVSEGFCLNLEANDSSDIEKTIRHLSYSRTGYDEYQMFNVLCETKCLRTFLPLKPFVWFEFLPKQVYHDLLPKLKCLRVLCLSKYDSIKELPSSIGDLKLLRYLDLSCTEIKQLPESICFLYNLLTLLLADCGSLNQLPSQMGRLVNLRHLDIAGMLRLTEMPLQISRLTNLQILSAFVVGNHSGSSISELGQLQQLRGFLTIFNLQNVAIPTDALEAKLKDKEYLTELVLKWSGHTLDTSNERAVLNMLQPHTNLKKLTIEFYGGTKFPDWLGDDSFSNIVSLRLSHCKHCFFLPPLGQLPSLKELFIIGFDAVERVGIEFNGNGTSAIKPFRSLEILWFERMLEWQEWLSYEKDAEEGHFPCLQELHIRKCPKLRGVLPNCLPSLRKLMISDCQQLMVSLPQAPNIYELHLGYSNNVVVKNVLPGLHKFTIRGCSTLESLPEEIMQSLCLEELKLYDCPSLLFLPQDVSFATLKRLEITKCKRLELPVCSSYASLQSLLMAFSCYSLNSLQLQLFPKLAHLVIRGCNLNSLSISEGCDQVLPSLNSMKISLCPNFASFPVCGLHAPNLTSLEVSDCVDLKSLPEKMPSLLPSLSSLKISNCTNLEAFPKGGLPSNLNSLSVSFCDKLTTTLMDWDLQRLNSLKDFCLRGNCEGLKSFPVEGFLPSSVTHLHIVEIPNLISLNNNELQLLTSLQMLEIKRCPLLQSMSGRRMSENLSVLRIEGCPLLKLRLQKDKGEDWPKVDFIPIIEIDEEMIV